MQPPPPPQPPCEMAHILANAKELVDEIVKVEYRLRAIMGVFVVAVFLSIQFYIFNDALFLLIFTIIFIPIMVIISLWAYRKYQHIYPDPLNRESILVLLYWRTYLRNAQSTGYNISAGSPFVLSDMLIMLKDIKNFFGLKKLTIAIFITGSIIMGILIILTFSFGVIAIFPMLIMFLMMATLEGTLWILFHKRFTHLWQRLEDYRIAVDRFWSTYW